MHRSHYYIVLCLFVVCLLPSRMYAQRMGRNQLEFGIQGGLAYYIGDAHPKMFQDVREAYGAEFSYLFNRRWSLMVQGATMRIAGRPATSQGLPDPNGELWTSRLVDVDVVARFNFLPFGLTDKYDPKLKAYTPYIFVGIGMTMHKDFTSYYAYIPFGVGFRWVCSEHVGMFLAWQNNLCFADNLEPMAEYNNIHELNGSNILNCDVISTIQFGIVFEFAKEKKICKFCSEHH